MIGMRVYVVVSMLHGSTTRIVSDRMAGVKEIRDCEHNAHHG